ncbi:MAG TPA: L-asparaginase [Cyanobacteria bacterium UBA8530]|nr:L-asparaginase [Cyanobacteria bacterium UBA8530]
MTGAEPLVEVWRGKFIESRHFGWAIAVRSDGERVFQIGEPPVLFARSSLKPIQAIPLVESGAMKRFDVSSEELALCCGSHGGEEVHQQGVRKLLSKIGLLEKHLLCGGDSPLAHNCSGKHAGMLALARHEGWSIEDYFLPGHPVQEAIRHAVRRFTGVELLSEGVDGCGVPVWRLPLENLARGFARMEGFEAGRAVVEAMGSHPYLVGGQGKFDTTLMQASMGRLISKGGGEGVHAGLIKGQGIGWAVKILDGNRRAVPSVVLSLLERLGQRIPLDRLKRETRFNHRGEAIGEIRSLL